MIRGMQDEDNDQFVAYFLPTDDTLDKRDSDKRLGVDYEDDVTYDYKLTKEYNWNVKNKASKGYEENFFFCYRPGEGTYLRVVPSAQKCLETITFCRTSLINKYIQVYFITNWKPGSVYQNVSRVEIRKLSIQTQYWLLNIVKWMTMKFRLNLCVNR